MTLFRLLAFMPEAQGLRQTSDNSAPKKNNASSATAANGNKQASQPGQTQAKSEAVKTKPGAVKEKVELATVIRTPASWAQLVSQIELNGLARQLAMHMVPTGLEKNQFNVQN